MPTKAPPAQIPPRDAARLKALTDAMRGGQKAAEQRAQAMIALREQGYSLDAIAAAAGVNREQVRKSVLRRTSGYPHGAARGDR